MWLLFLLSSSFGYFVKVFEDDFKNLDNWDIEVKTGQETGNNEWEYYTNRPENVFIRDGNTLVLKAQKEEYKGYHYTSGRIHSKKEFGPYGFFNVYAKVPKGNGIWPAIWLLPVYDSPYGTWAACGEIDIMETVCENNEAYSTLHFGQPWPNNRQYPAPGQNKYPFEIDWSEPHWFGVNWQPDYIDFYFDTTVVNGSFKGTIIETIGKDHWYSANSEGKRYPANAPFNEPFNMILNLAVGGSWPCSVPGCCDNVPESAEFEIYKVEVWEYAQ